MRQVINEVGKGEVEIKILTAINKCLLALSIDLSESQIKILINDIIDVYITDSIEDVLTCLKKGRQGMYGTNYNKLNMIVLHEWMTKYLDEKAAIRERELSKLKSKSSDPISCIDYEAYKARTAEAKQKKEKLNTRIKPDSYEDYKKTLEEQVPGYNLEQLTNLRDQARTLGNKQIEMICQSELDKR